MEASQGSADREPRGIPLHRAGDTAGAWHTTFDDTISVKYGPEMAYDRLCTACQHTG